MLLVFVNGYSHTKPDGETFDLLRIGGSSCLSRYTLKLFAHSVDFVCEDNERARGFCPAGAMMMMMVIVTNGLWPTSVTQLECPKPS